LSSCVICTTEVRDDARFCPNCGAEQPKQGPKPGSDDDPFIGQTVARNFKIEKLLGVGGMGKVYKARQLSLDKAVVIKILHDHFRDDPQLVQRFQREARAASRLNHPNSIQVIDFGQDENKVLYMAQEFLEGTDLFTVLKNEGPLPRERIARIMMQVCSALAEAHEQYVIHRDLKPENIMVEDRRGQRDFVKVLDFGIAKIQDPDDTGGQALTQAGMVCGTPEYMSPEQARGMALDSRSDLYSLGVLAYHLVTGELPFTADSPIGIVTKHILEAPLPPSQRSPQLGIGADLEEPILKAMLKEADQRYQTAAEMGEAFERLLYGQAPTGSMARRTGSFEGAPKAVPAGVAPTPLPFAPTVPLLTGGASSPPSGAQPTLTAPTPTGIAPQPSASVTDLRTRPKGSGRKWASLVAAAVIAAGGAAALDVVSFKSFKGAAKDPPVVAADPIPPVAVAEPGNPEPGNPEPGNPEPGNPEPGNPEPVVASVKPTQGKGPKQRGQKPVGATSVSQADKDEAAALFGAAQLDAISQDAAVRGEAYKKLMRAYQLNPMEPRPLLVIAAIHKTNGDMSKACNAATTFVKRKERQLSREQAASILKGNCGPEDLPPELR
jgi:eukaryotic-like serine/threonine-protein kinase